MNTSTVNQTAVLEGIVITVCILSMFGALSIIFSFVRWKDLRSKTRQLLVYLSIADFFTAFGNIIGATSIDGPGPLCVVQSVITTTSSLVSFFWTVFVALYLYLCLPGHSAPNYTLPVLHACAWGIPLVIVGIALGYEALGYSFVGWCWIDQNNPHAIMWGWITGKFWEILSYIATFILYYIIRSRIKESFSIPSHGPVRHNILNKTDLKLALIPLIFLVLRMWGTIRFILLSYGGESMDPYWLHILQGIGDSSQGFANFLLFCIFTEKVRQKYISCICGSEDEEEEAHAFLSTRTNSTNWGSGK